MKRNIPYKDHNWYKKNLITITKGGQVYDELVCTTCGLKGKRHGLYDTVEVNNKVPPCNKKIKSERPTKVRVIYNGGNIGVTPDKIYDVVDCPKEYLHKFSNDVWVISDKRNEPVRLLVGEYEPLNSNS